MKFININFLKTNKIDVILTQNKIRGGFESEYFLYIKNNFISTNKISDMSKIDYSGVFLKNINFNGKFLKSLNYLNIVNYLFFKNFFKKSNFLEKKFNNYNIFYNFSQSNGFFFDINFILQNIYLINEAIFTTKIIKIDKKKLKRKTNKFNFEIKYLKKKKRLNNVMKMVYLYSNNFNYYSIKERLLTSIMNSLFEQKNSDIFKKKIFTYNNALKKNFLKKTLKSN